ncbi:uncharacterized protein LOC131006603 [Salvia miltiorrhiza]|uniref:uncharacterized protein LOC131006603 n=1 Tax=Salvia miltiorrhiza TaxID=226208 RepID=UPI0025ABEC8E|nr:uncharacterized protein LOC131006603 [Salvia miltiorrhiza]
MLNLCSWGIASSWSWWRAGPSGRRAGGDRAAAGWRPRRWISSRRNRACSSGKRGLIGGARIMCADCGSSENADGGAEEAGAENGGAETFAAENRSSRKVPAVGAQQGQGDSTSPAPLRLGPQLSQ